MERPAAVENNHRAGPDNYLLMIDRAVLVVCTVRNSFCSTGQDALGGAEQAACLEEH